MTKLFVVILNWNRKDDTLACLKSVQALAAVNFELTTVLVDNASTDGTTDAVKKLKFPNSSFKVLVNKTNLGFTAGNNVGMRFALKSGADYVLVLNNDTIVDKNLLVQLVKAAKDNPMAGAISPKIYFARGFEFHKDRYKSSELGNIIWYAGGDMDWKNVYGTNHGVDKVDRGQFNDSVETDFATGACMLLRCDALNKVGLFDEKYFAYLEDADLSLRIKKNGWSVLYTPDGHLWHKVSQTSGMGSPLQDYFITRNRLLFAMRYAPIRSKLALFRESIKLLVSGRPWQKLGVKDFYLRKFGRGSWK